jgi:hypothetical protein
MPVIGQVFSEPTGQLSERLPIVVTQGADPDLRPFRETHAARNADEAGIKDGAEPRCSLLYAAPPGRVASRLAWGAS